MAVFIDVLAKKYNPGNIDSNMFAMDISAPHCVPVVCTQMIDEKHYGTITVDGIEISKGKCVKFDVSPCPMLFIPVGEVAKEYGRTYEVCLKNFKTKTGKKFLNYKFKVKTAERPMPEDKYKEREMVPKLVADEGIVLLENNGVLPLKEGCQVALLGAYEDFRISAIGAASIKPRWKLSLTEAMEKEGKLQIRENADVAIYVLSRDSAEGRDNPATPGGYYLTEKEKQELESAVKIHTHVILVLSTGYPIEMNYLKGLGLSGIIWSGYSGQRGSESLVDILIGRVNPSGRLADTWPLDYYDVPSAHNFINLKKEDPFYSDKGTKFGAKVFYEEGLYVGYRYFTSFDRHVAYDFGYGKSYTKFAVTGRAEYEKEKLNVEVKVKNIGEVTGKNSVLLYVSAPEGNLEKPKKVFVGFEKSRELKAGEEETLCISVPAKDFASFDEKLLIISKTP